MSPIDPPTEPVRAFIGLGSNLDDRESMLLTAIERLAGEDEITLLAVSTVRETEPEELLEQPRFLNAAAEVETVMLPRELLERLLAIETALGRTRDGERFGPRTIDLDLLLYGRDRVSEPGLEVPHPRLHLRRFVLEPLAELDPELDVPGWGNVTVLLRGLD